MSDANHAQYFSSAQTLMKLLNLELKGNCIFFTISCMVGPNTHYSTTLNFGVLQIGRNQS